MGLEDDDELPKEEERRPRIWFISDYRGECDSCGCEDAEIVAGVAFLAWAHYRLCRDCWFHFHDDFLLVARAVIPPT